MQYYLPINLKYNYEDIIRIISISQYGHLNLAAQLLKLKYSNKVLKLPSFHCKQNNRSSHYTKMPIKLEVYRIYLNSIWTYIYTLTMRNGQMEVVYRLRTESASTDHIFAGNVHFETGWQSCCNSLRIVLIVENPEPNRLVQVDSNLPVVGRMFNLMYTRADVNTLMGPSVDLFRTHMCSELMTMQAYVFHFRNENDVCHLCHSTRLPTREELAQRVTVPTDEPFRLEDSDDGELDQVVAELLHRIEDG